MIIRCTSQSAKQKRCRCRAAQFVRGNVISSALCKKHMWPHYVPPPLKEISRDEYIVFKVMQS